MVSSSSNTAHTAELFWSNWHAGVTEHVSPAAPFRSRPRNWGV